MQGLRNHLRYGASSAQPGNGKRHVSETSFAGGHIQDFDEAAADVLIVGSGAAGLMAALRAHYQGLSPLIIEKSDKAGGATAYSGGAAWIPNNHLQTQHGIRDSPEMALTYLNNLIGDVGEGSTIRRRQAYVDNSPKMVQFLADQGFRWIMSEGYSDYHPNIEGSLDQGRTIESKVFNFRKLGKFRKHMNVNPRYPLPPVYAYEAGQVTRAITSIKASGVLLRLAARWAVNLLLLREPVTLGHATAGQLVMLNLQQQTPIWLSTSLEELVLDNEGAVIGAIVKKDGQSVRICAKHGVVLCAGGFAKNQEMRESYQQKPTDSRWSSAPPYDNGDAIRAGIKVGAATALMDDAWWGPTMMEGNQWPYFALWDRARPFSIIVDSAGDRFMDEAESYVDAVHHQYERHTKVKAIPAWMIVDSNYRKRYSIGSVPPRTSGRKAIRDGFLFKADTLDELASKIGVNAEGLQRTVTRWNEMSKSGVDLDYGRGSNSYDHFFGDPTNKPNPNMGAISTGPFYAVKIYPGDLGTKGGLLTDEHARVLDSQGKTIQGLYASGNTTASVMGRRYAGAGATIGPALTFSFIAVDHIANQRK
ncbi:hypothetical protein AYO20_11456 [Fonsecaea nubica]|uniref:FAD-dependent oxidoreductase 2 FAD-binding domain-containing protein n=1 Tax=Fonsecaea nubica TaxID=856822 RepID=A0A178BTJ8_9EURO|nr:hypothetical protein AYO20_11456 [Fonsecaea nubica]OAL20929.1 hypothetical protein AYO20_11456 [Fonsecaea nubica]